MNKFKLNTENWKQDFLKNIKNKKIIMKIIINKKI